MKFDFLFIGILVGFLIALMIVPINLLTIRQGFRHSFSVGFKTGLGAAIGHTIYCAIAVFGLAALISYLNIYQVRLLAAAGVIMTYLGYRKMTKKSVTVPKELADDRLAFAVLSTFFLTLTHPLIIVAFVVALAALGVDLGNTYNASFQVTLGAFLGYVLWLLVLNSGVEHFKKTRHADYLSLVRLFLWVSGMILVVFGCTALWIAVWQASR